MAGISVRMIGLLGIEGKSSATPSKPHLLNIRVSREGLRSDADIVIPVRVPAYAELKIRGDLGTGGYKRWVP